MSVTDDLAAINTAIAAITGGAQEYQIGSRRIRKADLRLLFEERRRLEAQVTEETGGNIAVAYFDRR
jgi:hypothetical protein